MKKLIILIIIVACAGCGYHFRGTAINIAGVDHFTKVTVKNLSYEPALELIIKDDLTGMFATNGWLRSADDDRGAKLNCNIISFENKAVSYTPSDEISQYEIIMKLGADVRKDLESEAIFKSGEKRYAERYLVESDVKKTMKNKNDAIKKISEKYSHDIADLIAEGF